METNKPYCNTCNEPDPCSTPAPCPTPYPVCPPVKCPIVIDWRCVKYHHLTPTLQNALAPYGFPNNVDLETVILYLLQNGGGGGAITCAAVEACINEKLNLVNPKCLTTQSAWMALNITDKFQLVVDKLCPPTTPVVTITVVNSTTINLPTNLANISTSINTTIGTIATVTVARLTGPNTPTIVVSSFTPAALVTPTITVSNLNEGTHTFRITATDSNGTIQTRDFTIVVNYVNVTVSATGGTIQLPTSQITLNSSSTNGSGTVSSRLWTFISGPVTPNITTPATASTIVSGLTIAGTYVFRMTVTDSNGRTAFANATVIVNAALTFNTEISFDTTATPPSAAGVNAFTGAISAVVKVRFNSQSTPSGLPQNMDVYINAGSTFLLTINFPASYLTSQVQIVRPDGVAVLTTFQNGNVNI